MACEETDRMCRLVLEDETEASKVVQRYERAYGADDITVERDGKNYSLDEIRRGDK
jgi:hypothetical protein